jgi:hypothetical protein
MLYNITKTKKRNIKKYYSDTNQSISNSSELKKFFNKRYTVLDITIVSNKTNLYQGTDFDFLNKTNEEYLDFYSKRHSGAYFLSSKKYASIYGVNSDFSCVIYSTIPDANDVVKINRKYEYIYPLYYIEGIRGYNIKYGLNRALSLIDIGSLKNILTLLKIIDTVTGDDKDLKEEYLATLYSTCIHFDIETGYTLEPKQLHRKSKVWYDDELVVLFKDVFKPYILKTYGLHIDGWIYYQTDNIFHDEILVLSNEPLVIKNKYTLSPTLYKLPSRTEFLKKIEHTKIKNSPNIKRFTILAI